MRLQNDLLKAIENSGWVVTRYQGELNYLAWFHEIWVLESLWSPQLTLFLTFLSDPIPGNPNPFWIVGTSFARPENANEALGEPSLRMSPHWIDDLP